MLDVPNGIERGLLALNDTINIHRGGTHKAVYTYVQDKWQIRPDITLDLGLRHELYLPLVGYTPVGGQATYDPDTNSIRVAGYGDIPENLGVKTYWKNFNPRTGISWRPNDSNVFRAGYGVSALGLPSSWGQAYPIRQVQQITPVNSFAPTTVNLATGMPLPALVPIPASGILDATPLRAEALDVIDPNRTRGNAALVQRRVSAHPARRIYGGSCLCRQPRPQHPGGLQHERGSRRWRRPCRPAALHAVSEEPPTRRTRSRSDPNTTRCRSRSTAACETVCCSPTRTRSGAPTVSPMATVAGRSLRRRIGSAAISGRRSTRRTASSAVSSTCFRGDRTASG